MADLDIDTIRARHAESDDDIEDFRWDADNEGVEAHADRGALLAEVDRLTAEVDRLRDLVAYTGAALVNAGNSLAKSDGEVDRLTAKNEALRETLVEVAGGIGWRERDVWGRVIGQGTVWIELSEDADRVVREVLGITDEERTDG